MPKKVLVVDDEADIVAGLKLSLEESGYEVLTASNGIDALKISLEQKPNLVVLDVMMPQMSGLQFVEAFREIQPRLGFIPLIVMSARASMGDFFSSSDIYAFLKKPFETSSLIATVLKAIGTPMLSESVAVKIKQPEPPPAAKIPAQIKETPASAPPPKKIERPAEEPLRKPVQKNAAGKAIVVGVEENKIRKMKKYLETMGYAVEYAMDETDTLEILDEFSPDAVFCQYWEDASTFDAQEIYKTIGTRTQNNPVQVAVFCSPELSVEASKHFPPSHILIHQTMDELLSKASEFLTRHTR